MLQTNQAMLTEEGVNTPPKKLTEQDAKLKFKSKDAKRDEVSRAINDDVLLMGMDDLMG